MLLKRFTKPYIMALPAIALLGGMTACSSDDAAPQVQGDPSGIALKIPLSSTRGDKAEFDLGNLYIATYDKEGKLIETLVEKGAINRGLEPENDLEKEKFKFDNIEYLGDFGTLLSVYLPNSRYKYYKSNLQFAAFYLPEIDSFISAGEGESPEFRIPDSLSDLYKDVEDVYRMNHPGNGGVWVLPDGNENNIPMAGLLDVSSALSQYDPNMWSVNHPMYLSQDPLLLERAMAKVIVNQSAGVGHFSKVTLKTPVQGTLLADITDEDVKWPLADHVQAPTVIPDNEMFKQTLTATDDRTARFVFYTFESAFEKDEDRNLIEIEWVNTNGDTKSVTCAVKHYNNGQADAYYWNGVLRNHIYEFSIKRPGAITPDIELKVKEWGHDRYEVDF
ncbi:MAG: hypothetical protein K2G69_06400 [Muribaculaceae bacterium]|nr:hypothetical protein [Muribaculaceae bacterium]